MKWSNITLQQFQLIQDINNNPDFDELDKLLHIVCVVYNLTERQLSAKGAKKANKLIQSITKVFETEFKCLTPKRLGIYNINYNIDKLRFGQYVELNYFFKSDSIDNAHNILASVMHLPYCKNNSEHHSKIAEKVLNYPCNKVLIAVAAIKEAFAELNAEYRGLFDLNEDNEQESEIVNNSFNVNYGWIYSATQIAEHERITLDAAFNLPVRQALNDLSYLKSKAQYNEEQIKKHYGKVG